MAKLTDCPREIRVKIYEAYFTAKLSTRPVLSTYPRANIPEDALFTANRQIAGEALKAAKDVCEDLEDENWRWIRSVETCWLMSGDETKAARFWNLPQIRALDKTRVKLDPFKRWLSVIVPLDAVVKEGPGEDYLSGWGQCRGQ